VGAEPVKVKVLLAKAQIVGNAIVNVDVGIVLTVTVLDVVAVQVPEVTVNVIVLDPVEE
jgi:hypothetical protein